MGRGWLTKGQVDEIVASYRNTNSIIKTMEELHLSEVKVRRVLITEDLWSSETSKKIGDLKRDGMPTDEIAERLCMSVKNVQAYMPYENGAYGYDTKNAHNSRKSRDKARGKNAMDETEIQQIERGEVTMKSMMTIRDEEGTHEGQIYKMIQYAVKQGKPLLLVDRCCDKENGLPVVRSEAIETVREFERDWNASDDKRRYSPGNHKFIYIDCAPENMDYVSPGMPDGDEWLCQELMDGEKAKKRKKLTFSQFIDRLSTCVTGRNLNGSAYEKVLQTQVVLLREQESIALVFVNFHLLCDRSGGKISRYTAVGDMVGVVRQIWDSTHIPMLFLSSDEILRVLDKDDEGRKLQWRTSVVTV